MRLIAPRFPSRARGGVRISAHFVSDHPILPARNGALLRLPDTVDELTLAHGGVLLALPQVVLAGISPLRA